LGEDNLVVDGSPDASTTVRFKPVPAASTPFAVDDLIKHYQESAAAGEHHPVLLSGLFIFDLLVIHPFEDGNGRVARLLTGALLGEHGYTVGRGVSIEQAIAESADAYYQALLDSTHGWHAGTADPWPWLGYFTRLMASAYAVFADRAAAARTQGTKQERASTSCATRPAPSASPTSGGSARRQRPDDPAHPGTAEGRRQGAGRRDRSVRDLDTDPEYRTLRISALPRYYGSL
jgi:Fic family protein